MIIGVGTDIIEVKRIRAAIAKNERFVTRVYTPAEIAYCQQKSRPELSFAARFAAKEAVSKAFGTGIGKAKWATDSAFIGKMCYDSTGKTN